MHGNSYGRRGASNLWLVDSGRPAVLPTRGPLTLFLRFHEANQDILTGLFRIQCATFRDFLRGWMR